MRLLATDMSKRRPPVLDREQVARVARKHGVSEAKLAALLPAYAHGAAVLREAKAAEPGTDQARRLIGDLRTAAHVLKQRIAKISPDTSFHAELFSRFGFYAFANDLAEFMTVLDDLEGQAAGWKERSPDRVAKDALLFQLARLWKTRPVRPSPARRSLVSSFPSCATAVR